MRGHSTEGLPLYTSKKESIIPCQRPLQRSSSTNGNASDGFETTSDGELGSNNRYNDNETQQQHQAQEKQQSLSQADDVALKQVLFDFINYESYVPIKINFLDLFCLHLKQKAFEQANDVKGNTF